MTEAKQLYDDFLRALEPHLPRTVYQDVRRVRTLAWAVLATLNICSKTRKETASGKSSRQQLDV